MLEVTQEFTVADETNDYLWLHINGDESGVEIPVPKQSSQYPSYLERELRKFKQGVELVATLVSENDKNTAWRVKTVKTDPASKSPVAAGTEL